MNHSNSHLLYEDEPASGLLLRFILMIIPVSLIGLSFYLWFSGEGTDSLVLIAEGVFIGIILWFVLPRKYQVFENHIRVVFGGPFAISIWFNQISKIEVTTRTARRQSRNGDPVFPDLEV